MKNLIIQLQQPYIQDDTEIIGNFLFEKLHLYQKKEGLYQLWKASLLKTPRRQ